MGMWERERTWNKIFWKLDELNIDFRKDKSGDIDFAEDDYQKGFEIIAEYFPEYDLN